MDDNTFWLQFWQVAFASVIALAVVGACYYAYEAKVYTASGCTRSAVLSVQGTQRVMVP